MNEILHTDDQGRVVLRMQRRLAHPPAKVWRALTEPAELSAWYPFTATDIDLRVGGVIRFDLGSNPDAGSTSFLDATITELDPPRVFAFTEPAGEVMEREGENLSRFMLEPDGPGCLLTFTHAFYDRPAAAANATGWTVCLDAMEAALAGQPFPPPERMTELHEAYVAQFDLDTGVAEDTVDGWRVCFDRQLMQQPVEAVWAALAPQPPAVGDPAPAGATSPQVPAGAVTEVAAGRLLEYEWRGDGGAVAGRVRWELSTTPPGARITLTQTGPAAQTEARATALAAWRDHLAQLVKQLG